MSTRKLAKILLVLSLGLIGLSIILLDLLGDLSKDWELSFAVSCLGIALAVKVSEGGD